MEATGSDGLRVRGSAGWSPYDDYSIGSSSSSGTNTISTNTAYSSCPSTGTSTPFFFLDGHDGHYPRPMEEKKRQIKSLVQEFFGTSSHSTANGNIAGSSWDLKRWFTELGVGWVLDSTGRESAGMSELKSWISGLHKIGETIPLMAFLFPEMSSSSTPDPLRFAEFIQETMFKMLDSKFFDAILAPSPNATGTIMHKGLANSLALLGPYEMLSTLLGVHGALSSASAMIQLAFYSEPEEAKTIQGNIVSILSTKEGKLGEAICSKMEQTRTRVLMSVVCLSSSRISSDIHEATLSVMRYISFLQSHYSPLNAAVLEAARLGKYDVTWTGDNFPLNKMIVDITSCLEQRLEKVSKSFPDQGLGFLSLLNNSYFMQETLDSLFFLNYYSPLDRHVADLFAKVDNYVDIYIQVCWAPMLSCLFDPTPFYLRKTYSPLPKFESKFHKTYTTQKLWKVPDPNLRKRLRAAITEAIVPGYTKYIEDGFVLTQKFTPQELKEMLQELFEG